MAGRLLVAAGGLLAFMVLGAARLSAETVTLTGGNDATLYESVFGDVANGAGEYLFAGTTGRDSRRRALIRFDLDLIPASAIITNVTLRLHLSRTISASESVSIHRATSAWGEAGSDALLEEGGGAQAETGDATWLNTYYPNSLWSAPGGDFDPDPRASVGVVGSGYYDWTSPLLSVDVATWKSAPATNFGWLILGDEEFGATAKRFDSFQNANAEVRPALIVEYAPEPTSAALLAALWLCRIRRAA